jgi:glycosyltransferase involved in cell wall biosynthesis
VPLAPALAPVFALRHHRLWQALLSADVLIAPTGFVRDTFLRHGAPGEKLHVLDYGIRPPPVAPPPLRSAGPLHVVYLGGIARLKGVHVLVEAFNSLPPDAQLRIAGDLDRQPDYSRELRQRARHPGVQFLGQQGRAELWNLLAWADVVAVPSIWYEVSPLVMHEAFAMRRPIIASRHGSLAGWVRDGVDGVLAPPGDIRAWGEALNALAHPRDRLTQLQQAIRPVKTAGAHAAELETLYHRCLDRDY